MSQKGSTTTSDYMNFDSTMNKSLKLLKEDNKRFPIAFLAIIGINSGLRISDILRLTHEDLQSDTITIAEKKTGKTRIIPVNENLKKTYGIYLKRLGITSGHGPLFVSQKSTVYSVRHVNRVLQDIFSAKDKSISSHSLRKTFGRRVWENDNESERALIKLSQIFNHTNASVTRIYLGIRREELNDVYYSL